MSCSLQPGSPAPLFQFLREIQFQCLLIKTLPSLISIVFNCICGTEGIRMILSVLFRRQLDRRTKLKCKLIIYLVNRAAPARSIICGLERGTFSSVLHSCTMQGKPAADTHICTLTMGACWAVQISPTPPYQCPLCHVRRRSQTAV